MNIISRMFAYPILERELTNRIEDRDKIIAEKDERIAELETRLFIRFGLPPSGVDLSGTTKGTMIPAYRTGRQRVREMVTPPVVTLSAEEEKMMDDVMTQ
jgi:hypothetical protein